MRILNEENVEVFITDADYKNAALMELYRSNPLGFVLRDKLRQDCIENVEKEIKEYKDFIVDILYQERRN